MKREVFCLKESMFAVSFFLLTFMIPAVGNVSAAQAGMDALGEASGGMPVNSKRAINEAQINNFAKLQITLDKINDQYEKRMAADVEGDHSKASAEASEKMLEAIEEHDFTIAEYHRIAGAVIVDRETHQRVVNKIEDLRTNQ